ncbi:MAG: hypothetical protein KJ069_07770 [Anaerolineae bacterium]|nr:hypothetical protein [Anaerolineae bacterium]
MSQLRDKLLKFTQMRYETLPLLFEIMRVDDTLNIGEPVSRVLKCHLLSEALLDKLLQFVLEPNGDAVLAAQLSYSKKLDIASRCVLVEGYELLPDYVIGSLRKLNRIRNRLAHELGASVTREEVLDLFMGLDHPMPDPNNADVSMLVYHYTAFLFGNMLPKFETVDEEN